MRKSIFLLWVFYVSTTAHAGDAGWRDTLLEEQRATFKTVYEQAEMGIWPDSETDLSLLETYPLYPDLRAAYLGSRIGRTPNDELDSFLRTHEDYPFAWGLRFRWAKSLASREHWDEYLSVYRAHYAESDNATLHCLALQALLGSGNTADFVPSAIGRWLSPTSQPEECDAPFKHLDENGHLTDRMYEERLEMAVNARQFQLAAFLARPLDTSEQKRVQRWDRAHTSPSREIRKDGNFRNRTEDLNILAYAFERLAITEPGEALDLWPEYSARFDFDEDSRRRIGRKIALRAAYRYLPAARGLLAEFGAGHTDDEIGIWRIRLAVRAGDWREILDASASLSRPEGDRDTWRYWRARALEATGDTYVSEQLFMRLAGERSYYGFLSADRMHVPYAFQHASTDTDEELMEELALRRDVVRAREWFLLGRHSKGRSEWSRAMERLDPLERAQAAVLAHRWGWHSRAIATAAATGLMNDLEIRYPTPFMDWFESVALTANINQTWALGVARSESLFMPDAGSRAGALGLMQLMPATGKLTAREINLDYRGRSSLLDPQINIRLGTQYLSNMLVRFENNQVLATAAYNAGPHRVERWLPDHTALPADVWVDTIPFKETRRYVRRVLTSQAIFYWRLNGSVKRLGEIMEPVRPSEDVQAVAKGGSVESSLKPIL